jgi:Methylase of polypeptide chain release factors
MPNKFKYRSDQKEMLDGFDIPQELLVKNLKELDFLNQSLGGHAISLRGLKKLVTDKEKTYKIADLGCGSGDTLKFIAKWARANGYKLELTGVDMNINAIEYFNAHCSGYPEITGVAADYKEFLKNSENIDIVLCSLFCHHLNDNELLDLLTWVRSHAAIGIVISDLQRHWLAYYGAKAFTYVLKGSVLAKNDGPISVLRGFKRTELDTLFQKAGIVKYSITLEWAFRYLVVGQKL